MFTVYSRFLSRLLLRRSSSNISLRSVTYIHFFPQQYLKIHGRFKYCRRKMNLWFWEQSIQLFKACTRQCEFIAAQNVSRSVQFFYHYTRIWDQIILGKCIPSWKYKVEQSTKNLLFGCIGVTLYNWDKERISNKEIYSYSSEFEQIRILQTSTIICAKCHLRLIIDIPQTGLEYCRCPKVKSALHNGKDETKWDPFIERQDMIFWRREEKDFKGLYAYKVYGSFDDVSAEDFLQIQIDLDYRKKWDTTAKQLEIIDTDTVSTESNKTCSDIIYWEMAWPRMFTNRDYVYQRRWLYDKKNNIIIIISKSTEHPNAPIRSDTHRVTNYWSYMVIKPYKNFSEPGIEFGLTYFDDPGVNLPSAFTAWITRTDLPEYLYRMRQASKDYKTYKASQDDKIISKSIIIINTENDINEITHTNKLYNQTINEKNQSNQTTENLDDMLLSLPTVMDEGEVKDNNDLELNEKEQGFLNNLFFAKLFV